LGSSNEKGKSIQKLSQIVEDPRYKLLSVAVSVWKASSILMGGEATMALLTLGIKSILEFTMARVSLLVVKLISMESRASGAMLKPDWLDSVVFIKRPSFYI
jgi:hypothetical protein